MEIAIIGGGITGMTTALALHKLGIQATVYEQAGELSEIGAGVWLQPNAVQVLQWLGLGAAIKAAGCVLNKMEISYPDLSPVRKIKEAVVADKFGNQTIAIHRGKLQRVLFEAFSKVGKVELGMRYQSYTEQNGHFQIQFDGQTRTADLILGADGIKSGVRASMGFPSHYRKTGQICARGIAQIQLPDHLKNEGKEVWGRKLRFGFSELYPGHVYFFVVFNEEISPSELNTQSIAALYKGFDPIVPKIIKATEFLHTTELFDLKRLATWHKGHICLLGDAAHATTPNMGQGACQGIEDAYYFSHLLKQHQSSPIEAFNAFEQKRRKKVDFVVNNSWTFGKMAHHPFGQQVLKGIMKFTPEKMMSNQINELYRVEAF